MVENQPKRKARPGVDEYGRTPLHYACNNGNARLCAELLATGSSPNAGDDNGSVPLHFAAQAKSAAVTSILLDAGADVNVNDRHGNAPLWIATMNSRGRGEVIGLLRAAGADPYSKNNAGVSPVEVARRIANFPVAQFFSDLPLDP